MIKRITILTTLLLLASTAAVAQSAGKMTLQEKRALAKLACKDFGGGESIARLNCQGKALAQIINELGCPQAA